MDEDWKTKIPSMYFDIVGCYCLVNKLVDSFVDIVMCTGHGHLIEFFNKKISGVCDIQTTHAESVIYFVSYKPHTLYYIVKAASLLKIVRKKLKLEIVQEFKNVERYVIKDFLEIGSPQLAIWFMGSRNSKPDILTDFSDRKECETELVSDAFSQVYYENLQEIKMRVKETEEKLKIKRGCRKMSSYAFLENQNKKFSLSEDQFVCLVGNKKLEMKKGSLLQQHQQPLKAVQVANIWQKVYNGFWVLGISIHNVGENCITDLNLTLKQNNGQQLVYSTHILAWENKLQEPHCRGEMYEEWQEVISIPKNSKAVIIGKLKQPKFLGNAATTINGVITYGIQDSSEAGFQVCIPSFFMDAEELSRELMVPFTQDKVGEADLLSVLVTSEYIELSVSTIHCSLKGCLEKDLGFEHIPILGNCVHKGQLRPGLKGIMLWIKNRGQHNYNISVYAKDMTHVFLLVHCLYAALPMNGCIFLPSSPQTPMNSKQFYNSLCSEIDFVISKSMEWNSVYITEDAEEQNRPSIKVPRDIYVEFRKKLSELEMLTDKFIMIM